MMSYGQLSRAISRRRLLEETGHDQPYIASGQRSLKRLLLSETCQIAYECNSAKGDNALSIDRVRCTRKTGRWLASRS